MRDESRFGRSSAGAEVEKKRAFPSQRSSKARESPVGTTANSGIKLAVDGPAFTAKASAQSSPWFDASRRTPVAREKPRRNAVVGPRSNHQQGRLPSSSVHFKIHETPKTNGPRHDPPDFSRIRQTGDQKTKSHRASIRQPMRSEFGVAQFKTW